MSPRIPPAEPQKALTPIYFRWDQEATGGEQLMDNKLISYNVQQERQARREAQRLLFHRNQAIGLLLAAAGVLAYRLLHTPSGWLFPPGWWRLW